MHNQAISLITQELTMAGMDEEQQKYQEMRQRTSITRHTKLPPIRFLFTLFGIPCFPRGELVTITGKHKTGKTYICSILMSLALLKSNMSLARIDQQPLHVLWIDTEQSDTTTQDILCERIAKMVGDNNFCDDNYEVRNLRQEELTQRMPFIQHEMQTYHPDLMIFDGVRDVISDINDYPAAQQTVEQLLRLVSESNCCMICLLHENKAIDDHTLRGAIGTELQNKCFEQYQMTKSPERIYTFTQTHTRKYDIETPLRFTLDNDGLPVECSYDKINQNTEEQTTITSTNKYRLSNGLYDTNAIFNDILKDGKTMRSSQLRNEVMSLAKIRSKNIYDTLREEAVSKGIITRIEKTRSKVYYQLTAHYQQQPKLNLENEYPF